jgi:hypothetical protein
MQVTTRAITIPALPVAVPIRRGCDGQLGCILRRLARRALVTVIGGAVIGAGVAMLVLPGPGLVTIAVGLGVLGREYAWAARADRRVRARVRAVAVRAGEVRVGKAGRHGRRDHREDHLAHRARR